MGDFTTDLADARAAAASNEVPVLTITIVPSGMEGFPDTYVAIDDVVTWKPVNAQHPEGQSAEPDDLERGLLYLEDQLLPNGGPAIISTYLQSIA